MSKTLTAADDHGEFEQHLDSWHAQMMAEDRTRLLARVRRVLSEPLNAITEPAHRLAMALRRTAG